MKTTMRLLTLGEYQTTSVQLSPEERSILSSLVTGISVVPRTDLSGHYDVTPGSYVGGVTIGSLAIEIRPKVPIDRLLFLISYGLHRHRWRESALMSACYPSLVDAIIAGFLVQTRRSLSRGLLHGYRHQDDSLTVLRGRIRFEDQIRDRWGQMPPVEVGYDEFTDDIEENRLIKAAASRLGLLHVRSDSMRRGLLDVEATLQNVRLIRYDPRLLPTVRYTRLNEHYRPAVELAKLILRSASYETHHGGIHASALLVDMNQVFEDFVVEALRDTLNLSPFVFPQQAAGKRLRLDLAGSIGLYPDISWWEGSCCTFVGDAKYKRTEHADAPNSDLYQLLAYTVAADVPCGLLIYAAGQTQPEPHEVNHLGTKLEVVAMDLQEDPQQILTQIAAIATRIRRMREVKTASTGSFVSPVQTPTEHVGRGMNRHSTAKALDMKQNM